MNSFTFVGFESRYDTINIIFGILVFWYTDNLSKFKYYLS